MKIIFGLGNPWPQYSKTRHNAGFLCVNFLQKNNFSDWHDTKDFQAIISEKIINGEKILLVKPVTFMNRSGETISKIVHFYKVSLEDIIVVSDDIDMDFGKIRLRLTGRHGWQNGLRDIINRLGTIDFARLKIGIGRHPQMAVADWVLSRFSNEECETLENNILPSASEQIFEFLWLWD